MRRRAPTFEATRSLLLVAVSTRRYFTPPTEGLSIVAESGFHGEAG